MLVNINVNGKKIQQEIEPDLPLLDFLRANGCYSVKRGCETSNCGLCTVFLNEKPVLTCSILAARADGRPGSGAVWILQSGICDECHRAFSGKSAAGRK